MSPEEERQLCARCLDGDREAHATFDAQLVAPLRVSDDVKQWLRQELFMGDALRSWTGQGSLGRWVRAVAERRALRVESRDRERPAETTLIDHLLGPSPNPEQATQARDARAALGRLAAEAVARLDAADRLLLEQYYVDGFGLETLGRLHQLHASSVMRRLRKVRAAVLADVREHLGQTDSVLTLSSLVRAADDE